MLEPLLATPDPYAAASTFSLAGWKLEYETSRSSSSPRACVSLALARVILTTASPGAVTTGDGVTLMIKVPPRELSGVFLLHRAAGLAISELVSDRVGDRGFEAEIAGYRFVIMAGDPDPDLALIATDPRIAALAGGLRQRDGNDSLTDTALRMVEAAGDSVRGLRLALQSGIGARQRIDLGEELAEVVISAATLARQLGIDLDLRIEGKLGTTSWRRLR